MSRRWRERWRDSRSRYLLTCALRATRWPFVALFYLALFRMTPRFGPYMRGRDYE